MIIPSRCVLAADIFSLQLVIILLYSRLCKICLQALCIIERDCLGQAHEARQTDKKGGALHHPLKIIYYMIRIASPEKIRQKYQNQHIKITYVCLCLQLAMC